MKLEYFIANKDLFLKETDKLLVMYRTRFQMQLEREKEVKKNIFSFKRKDKIKYISNNIQEIKNKICKLDILNRFIRGESFTLNQLSIIINDQELVNNSQLNGIIKTIRLRISEIEVNNNMRSKLNENIYIEDLYTQNLNPIKRK